MYRRIRIGIQKRRNVQKHLVLKHNIGHDFGTVAHPGGGTYRMNKMLRLDSYGSMQGPMSESQTR